jgi:enamine deaminase RidA (YjgF/YER057c/UK114 family)
MQHERLNPPGVHAPQANYSHVTRVADMLYLSGQVALDEEGELVGRGDPEAQAEQCWRNIEAILAHFGATLDHVVKTTTYITNPGFRTPVSGPRDRRFNPPYPASTLVTVAALAFPDFLVEIEAVAALDEAGARGILRG